MKIDIRPARARDIDAMVLLIEARRAAYERYEPIFWRRARNAAGKTKLFYRYLLWRRSAVVLVASVEGAVAGFLIASVARVPPIYAPGGPTAVIDDFAVASAEDWMTVGNALLAEARSIGRKAGWCQIVVVCGSQDELKTAFLRTTDLRLASTWWTAET
jgi:hypothetical protein